VTQASILFFFVVLVVISIFSLTHIKYCDSSSYTACENEGHTVSTWWLQTV